VWLVGSVTIPQSAPIEIPEKILARQVPRNTGLIILKIKYYQCDCRVVFGNLGTFVRMEKFSKNTPMVKLVAV
jgi:hypothetical protein